MFTGEVVRFADLSSTRSNERRTLKGVRFYFVDGTKPRVVDIFRAICTFCTPRQSISNVFGCTLFPGTGFNRIEMYDDALMLPYIASNTIGFSSFGGTKKLIVLYFTA